MRDWCEDEGARRLREKIAKYWEERGFEVDIDLVGAEFVPSMRSTRTDVRSNMINGMPRRKRKAEPRASYKSSD